LSPDPPSDGAAHPRRSLLRHPRLVHALGLMAAAALTWLIWRGYRQPGFLLDLSNAMFVC
jgi:hypothetical protein